jgi:ABC-type multidrug transport system fused ATPase/permease subunit
MAGLLQPSTGQVWIADRSASIVFQEPFLFSGTIRRNIDMGRQVGNHALDRALYLSAADEFVGALDDGVDTVIGERGISLSGGQRQRISLARAIAQESSVLLLDDTTSALDTSTESIVIDRLRHTDNIVTTIIVASRPSTIALADEVIFIENGSLSDQGTHPDLMVRNDNYRLLMQSFERDREQGTL